MSTRIDGGGPLASNPKELKTELTWEFYKIAISLSAGYQKLTFRAGTALNKRHARKQGQSTHLPLPVNSMIPFSFTTNPESLYPQPFHLNTSSLLF